MRATGSLGPRWGIYVSIGCLQNTEFVLSSGFLMAVRMINLIIIVYMYMGAYLGKGTYWQCLYKFDCRETTLSNAANHFEIFLIEFEICLFKHLYFLYIRNPLFPIVVFISMLWQLKVNMFYQKNTFPII